MSNRDCSNVYPFSYFNFTLIEKINMKNSIITYFVVKTSQFPQFQFLTQPPTLCSKLTIKALEQGVKYVQSEQ